MKPEEAIIAARMALADAEFAIRTWRDDFCAFIDRCQRLGEIDLISADQVRRCLHRAAVGQCIELERAFYKEVGADVVVVQLPPEEAEQLRALIEQARERRRWQG